MLRQLRKTLGLGNNLQPWAGLKRHQYKSIWNSVSSTEREAKIAVTGTLDKEEHDRSAKQTCKWIQNYVGISQDDVVLDLGAGFGRVGDVMAPLCKKWIGTDVSENMVAMMRQRLSHHRDVEVIATNGFDLSQIASNSIDLCYCTIVFMHLDEWERYNYIAEGFRVLKPGGRMIVDNISLANDQGWKIFIDHAKIPVAERPPHISRTSTPQELTIYFQRAGFLGIQSVEHGFITIAFGKKPN